MPDIQCINPACQRMNSDARKFCFNCGWQLPKTDASPPLPSEELEKLRAENLQLQQQISLLSSGQLTQQQQLDEAIAAHTQLQAQHDQLASTHGQLQDQHKQLSADYEALKQKQAEVTPTADQGQLAAAKASKQKAEGRVQDLLAQIKAVTTSGGSSPQAESETARLGALLATAQKDLADAVAKVEAFEASPEGKETWPLRSKIISWALAAIVGLGGGAAIGIKSPLNLSNKQVINTQNEEAQQKQSLSSAETQLASAKQDVAKATQDEAALQQTNAQLQAQVDSLTKGSQTGTKALTAAQSQLAAAKAEAAKEHSATVAAQEQLSAEKSHNQQLSERAAKASALEAIIAAHPSLNYKGPTQGTITVRFDSKNDKPANISLDHLNGSSSGNVRIESVSGAQMPGIAVIVEPMTKNVSIASPPSRANGWQKMTLTVQGKGSNEAVLRWSVF
jgi:hypothetical protein